MVHLLQLSFSSLYSVYGAIAKLSFSFLHIVYGPFTTVIFLFFTQRLWCICYSYLFLPYTASMAQLLSYFSLTYTASTVHFLQLSFSSLCSVYGAFFTISLRCIYYSYFFLPYTASTVQLLSYLSLSYTASTVRLLPFPISS